MGKKNNRHKHNQNKQNRQHHKKHKARQPGKKILLTDILGHPPLKSYSSRKTLGTDDEFSELNNYSVNRVPSLIDSKAGLHKHLVMKNTMPQIARLFKPTFIIADKDEELKNLYPSSYQGPPGPACNWRKCSNKGGCGTECVCHPAGKYGWRCIPKCCIGRDGYPPCRHIYKYPVVCTLPCSTWPGLCQENFWNPYHTYQGPLEYPKGQPNLTANY